MENTTESIPLISICICTFRRPAQLEILLNKLGQQESKGLFQFSLSIVDNDAQESARTVVESWAEHRNISVSYAVVSQQNIALARNASVAMATGDLFAFIDDDEEPSADWLRMLYQTLLEYHADGVMGPVLPSFEEGAPAWAVKGQVFQRPGFKTGTAIHWGIAGMGNALLKREFIDGLEGPFNPELGAGGEDTDLFRRAMARGNVAVWSAEAVCYERIPQERTRISFQLRRALMRGKVAARGPRANWQGMAKSALAVMVYVVTLPLCWILGSHVFVTYLVRSFDHLGKLLAGCGIDLVGDKYITS